MCPGEISAKPRLAAGAPWNLTGVPRASALQSILEQSGTAFDPEAVRVLLGTTHRTELPRQVREISVEELRPGMLIARGIYVPSGMLLIAEGQELTPAAIAKLKSNAFARQRISEVLVYR